MKKDKVKKGGFFTAGDLIVYAVLIVLVVVLFLMFVFGGKEGSGIAVESGGERVYVYMFGKGGKISPGKEAVVEEKTEGRTVVVTIFTDERKEEYNIIVIDTEQKTAIVSEANCSFRKDCTHMAAIAQTGDVIICVPHTLIVKAIGGQEDFSPTIG